MHLDDPAAWSEWLETGRSPQRPPAHRRGSVKELLAGAGVPYLQPFDQADSADTLATTQSSARLAVSGGACSGAVPQPSGRRSPAPAPPPPTAVVKKEEKAVAETAAEARAVQVEAAGAVITVATPKELVLPADARFPGPERERWGVHVEAAPLCLANRAFWEEVVLNVAEVAPGEPGLAAEVDKLDECEKTRIARAKDPLIQGRGSEFWTLAQRDPDHRSVRLRQTTEQLVQVLRFRRVFREGLESSVAVDWSHLWPTFTAGTDKYGHLAIFERIGDVACSGVLGMSARDVKIHRARVCEKMMQLNAKHSKEQRQRVYQFVWIIDLKALGAKHFKLVNSTAKQIVELHNHVYPETLFRMFIVNAPALFKMIWSVMRPWCDPASVVKINILGGKASFLPHFRALGLDLAELPHDLGGERDPATMRPL